MGHINLLAEELTKFLARCPPDLYRVIADSYNQSEWDAYVNTTLNEINNRISKPLAGGKPIIKPLGATEGNPSDAGVPSEDSSDEDEDGTVEHSFGEPLSRTQAKDGFADRGGGFDTFGDRHEGDDDGNTVDRVSGACPAPWTRCACPAGGACRTRPKADIVVLADSRRRGRKKTGRLFG